MAERTEQAMKLWEVIHNYSREDDQLRVIDEALAAVRADERATGEAALAAEKAASAFLAAQAMRPQAEVEAAVKAEAHAAGVREGLEQSTEMHKHAVGDLGPACRHVDRLLNGELTAAPAVLREIQRSLERCLERLAQEKGQG